MKHAIIIKFDTTYTIYISVCVYIGRGNCPSSGCCCPGLLLSGGELSGGSCPGGRCPFPEFPSYWDWLWCPGLLPVLVPRFPYLVFSIRSYLPLDFNRVSSLRPTYRHPF